MLDTKQFHNSTDYNSINTIMSDNIVVIRYNEPGPNSFLTSMTVGHYYIAKKTWYNSEEVYELITHDIINRTGTSPIRVKVRYSIGRFTEHKVVYWCEQHEFQNNNIMLIPVITKKNILDGKGIDYCISPLCGQTITHNYITANKIPAGISLSTLYNILRGNICLGYKKLLEQYNNLPTTSIINVGQDITVNNNANNTLLTFTNYSNGKWKDTNSNTIDYGVHIHKTCARMLESEADMERRINTHIPNITRHKADIAAGIKDEYLLIN